MQQKQAIEEAEAPKVRKQLSLIDDPDVDFQALAEKHGFNGDDGRLVLDPAEARVEFGPEIADRLKTDKTGEILLWPQPTHHRNDPQNWSSREKNFQLLILTLAAFVPDFNSSLGIASLFPLAAEFNTTTDQINNVSSNWSIFMLGVASPIVVLLVKRFGRLPVLFWGQVIGLGFTIGCTVSQSLGAFAACRILQATFQTAPQVLGLYTICDMYPFHLQARSINLWNLGFIVSPFIGPALLGFMIERTTWRWIYGVGCIYDFVIICLIALFAKETMFDRHLRPIPQPDSQGLKRRFEDLVGITAFKMRKYRPGWGACAFDIANVFWRPQAVLPGIFILAVFGFGIGINVTNAVFVGSPPPLGYGLEGDQLAGTYWAPIGGVLVGELIGGFLNDFIARRLTKRNGGVFLAEMRLWTIYISLPFFVAGFVTLGYCFELKLNVGGLVMGWLIAEAAILMITVAIYAYLNNCFPTYQGETSAIVNLWRTLGGFAVPYFQIEWAEAHGASQTFGVEAAIVVGLFLLIIPFLQLKGASLRHQYSIARKPRAEASKEEKVAHN